MIARDREWLKAAIAEALSWDLFVVEGVVDAIDAAGSQEDVDDLVTDFMGGDATVQQLVAEFIDYRDNKSATALAAGSSGAGPANTTHTPRSGSLYSQQPGAGTIPGGQSVGDGPGATTASAGKSRGSGLSTTGGRVLVDLQTQQEEEQEHQDGPEIIDGIRVKRSGKRGKAGTSGAGSRPQLEKPVVNCLACGKVYDCRPVTNDIINFLESGGECTYCGARVALSSGEQSETRAPSAAAPATPPQGGSSSASAAASGEAGESSAAIGVQAGMYSQADDGTAAEAAVAFKDRLVEYDRNAGKRTAVIDDQSDFFEIDSNAWLTAAERAQLKARQQAIEESDAARKKRITISFDLMGRQVVMAEDGPEDPAMLAAAQAAQAAADATAFEKPQGGGTGAMLASKLAEQLAPWRNDDVSGQPQRITPNPDLPGPAPMFVRSAPRPRAAPPVSEVRVIAGENGTSRSSGQGNTRGGTNRAPRVESTVSCTEMPTAAAASASAPVSVSAVASSSAAAKAAASASQGLRGDQSAIPKGSGRGGPGGQQNRQQNPGIGRGRGRGRGGATPDAGPALSDCSGSAPPKRDTGIAGQAAARAAAQAIRGIRDGAAVVSATRPLTSSAPAFQPAEGSGDRPASIFRGRGGRSSRGRGRGRGGGRGQAQESGHSAL